MNGEVRYREVLTTLRCEAGQMRDCTFSSVRESARRMLQTIDGELSKPTKPQTESHTAWTEKMDPASIPNEVIITEIARRVREIRHVSKLCTRCKTKAVRARGLCMTCYKQSYKRGEFLGSEASAK